MRTNGWQKCFNFRHKIHASRALWPGQIRKCKCIKRSGYNFNVNIILKINLEKHRNNSHMVKSTKKKISSSLHTEVEEFKSFFLSVVVMSHLGIKEGGTKLFKLKSEEKCCAF